MKVPHSLRSIYESLIPDMERLKTAVDEWMNGARDSRWHYESRVKSVVSFAQKLESGRFASVSEIDDLFACTVVVENLDRVPTAETRIRDRFELAYRKPANPLRDAAPPDSFRFEDLRLYVKWRDGAASRPTGLEGRVFEVQIKTFLQHAWGIATHDLLYKAQQKSWARERIGFQTRALLETAELALKEAVPLSTSSSLDRSDWRTADIREVLLTLQELWPPEKLPDNTKLLAETVFGLLREMKIPIARLKEMLQTETAAGGGMRLESLSPYGVIVQCLANRETQRFLELLSSPTARSKVLLYDEISLPVGFPKGKHRNVIEILGRG